MRKEIPYIDGQDSPDRRDDHQQTDEQGADDDPGAGAKRASSGDELVYSIEGDRVILTKAPREPADDPFAAFEWSSEADREAYAGF